MEERPASVDLSFMKLSTLQPNIDPMVNKNIHLVMIGKQDLIHYDQEGLTIQFSLVHNMELNVLKFLLCLVQKILSDISSLSPGRSQNDQYCCYCPKQGNQNHDGRLNHHRIYRLKSLKRIQNKSQKDCLENGAE